MAAPLFLEVWGNHTNFTSLRSLILGGPKPGVRGLEGVSGQSLSWIAQNCSFPHLTELSVGTSRRAAGHPPENPNYTADVLNFLNSFPPLKKLVFTGLLDPDIFEGLLARHGQTLKELQIHPIENRRI